MTSREELIRGAVKIAALPLGLGSWRRAGDVVILCYHRVGAGGREIDVPGPRFEQHLEWLASTGSVRTLDQALSDPTGGVVVSIDDGLRDFHEVVVPLLARYDVPALLYLATGFVDRGDARSGFGPDEALTWTMLEEAVSTGLVTVGSHTHSHADLSRASEEVAADEMRRSKDLVEDRLGRPCSHFAPPWGKTSPAVGRLARQLFTTAASHGWMTNRRGRIDPYGLGRTPVLRSDAGFFFRGKVRGQLNGERFAYRALRRGPWTPPGKLDEVRAVGDPGDGA